MRARHRLDPRVESIEGRVLLHASISSAATAAVQSPANTPPVILSASEVIQNRTVLAFQITFTKPRTRFALTT